MLPSRFPNLLVNGSSGIAVGMATNMPPHHLGEVVDAIVAMIDEPTIDVDRLAQHVKGPDFPTGAIILGREGIRESYRSGRGRIVMRARAHIEELRGGRTAVIVTELPYGVRKGGDEGVIRKIAELVKDNMFTEISGIKDLSDKTGMRIQIELKREAVPQVVLNKLYKRTPLQSTFGYNAVALVDGVPRTLSLLELIRHYLDHQREVVTRRLKYELRNAVRRAHVLEGYLIALDKIDGDHRAHPWLRQHGVRTHGADGAIRALGDSGAGDPRHAARPPHRPCTQGDRGGVQRPAGTDLASCVRRCRRGEDRRASSARSCWRSSRSTDVRTIAAPRSRSARTRSRSRT